MATEAANLQITRVGGETKLFLDNRDISDCVYSYTLTQSAGEWPTLTLKLRVCDVAVNIPDVCMRPVEGEDDKSETDCKSEQLDSVITKILAGNWKGPLPKELIYVDGIQFNEPHDTLAGFADALQKWEDSRWDGNVKNLLFKCFTPYMATYTRQLIERELAKRKRSK